MANFIRRYDHGRCYYIKTVQIFANILGDENILEGSVRKTSNALRITAQVP